MMIIRTSIAALLVLVLGGCAVVVKQGAPSQVDPLTRRQY